MQVIQSLLKMIRDAIVVAIKLENEGLEFVKSELENTGLLSVKILEIFNNKGKVFAPFEDNTSLSEAKDFKQGNGANSYYQKMGS